MRRLLIVSPSFPPINAPDMQRTRLALPYLRGLGWEPVVLAVTPESIGTGVLEPLLEETYPKDIRVIRVKGVPRERTRWLGVGSVWWRCGRALRRAGDELLAGEKFDLAFFSTTQFDAFTLGPRWQLRFQVPYVLDYQDPWVNSYYHRTNTRPPGGWLKFNFTQALARRREPTVVRQAAGIVSVSTAYIDNLVSNYPGLDRSRLQVIPFGAAPSDFEVAARHRPAKPLIDFDDGNIHHVYVGRAGRDMEFSLGLFFRAFRRYLDSNPVIAQRLRFHFIGTDYAPPPAGREWVTPVAKAEKVDEYVHEHCHRVPYFDALHYLLKADALMVFGSDDASYTASKLFPYVLARRPMLVLFHESSLVMKFARDLGLPHAFGFTAESTAAQVVQRIHDGWFAAQRIAAGADSPAFRPFTAEASTARLAASFDAALARQHT